MDEGAGQDGSPAGGGTQGQKQPQAGIQALDDGRDAATARQILASLSQRSL